MYKVLEVDHRFRAPFGAIVCGPTMSGKTVFVSNLIQHRDKMIDKVTPRVVYCYGQWQEGFEVMQRKIGDSLEFVKGIDEVFSSESFFDPKVHTLLILDDLAQELTNHPQASKLFTQGIHHKNVSVVLIMQNLYKQGKSMRDIHLNCQYLILFRNCRDVNQIKTLSRQMGLSHLPSAYEKVTAEAFQPLIVDMRPGTPDYLRVRSHVLPQDYTRVYLKSSTSLPCRKA